MSLLARSYLHVVFVKAKPFPLGRIVPSHFQEKCPKHCPKFLRSYLSCWRKNTSNKFVIPYYQNKVATLSFKSVLLVSARTPDYISTARSVFNQTNWRSWNTLSRKQSFKRTQIKTVATKHRASICYRLENLRSFRLARMPTLSPSDKAFRVF